jgi:hypothetical protein
VLDTVCEVLSTISKPKKKTENIGTIGMVPILFLVNQCTAKGIATKDATATK